MSRPRIERTSETIDEETALKYLEHNTANRPVRARFLQHLPTDMLNGNWRPGTSAIGYRDDGTLTDGQHRLNTVVNANTQARKQNQDPIIVQMDVRLGLHV